MFHPARCSLPGSPPYSQDYSITRHARIRLIQRSIHRDDILDALQYGRWIHAAGIDCVFLGQRDVPAGREAEFAARHLNGLVLLLAHGRLVTGYKNRTALRAIRCRQGRRR